MGSNVSDKKCSKIKDSSKGQGSSGSPAGSFHDEQPLFRSSASVASSDHRTFFNDPAQVRQWAVNSATGSDTAVDFLGYGHCSASYGIDPSMTTAVPHMQGSVSVLRSDTSHLSFHNLTHMPETNGTGINYDTFSSTTLGNTTSPIESGLGFHPFQDIDSNVGHLEEQYPREFWHFPATDADDAMFTNPVAPSVLARGGSNGDSGYHSGWSMTPVQTGDEILSAGLPCTSYPMAYSPLSAVDPSVSSSFSQNSFLGQQPNTPISPAFHEAAWSSEQAGTLEDNAMFPAFTIGDSMQGSIPSERMNKQVDMLRFVGHAYGPFYFLT